MHVESVSEMVTPTKQEIEEKAFEINAQRSHDINNNTPEVSELQESGVFEEARNDLMTSEATQYRSHIEEQARALGLIEDRIEIGKQIKPYDFQIDLEEAKRSGVFVCGGKGQAKTNLAKIIADKFLKLGCVVKVFDISKAWLKSSMPHFYEVKRLHAPDIDLYQSVIYDLSRLKPKEVRSFITKVLEKEWNMQIEEDQRKWIIYVFEEVQSLIPQGSLRSNEAQATLRLLTSGRNFDLGFVAITQRPALTDTSVFELCFQRYFARLDGANDKDKVAQYIGAKAYSLEKLKLGQFFYDKGDQTKWITTEEFKAKAKPKKLEISQSLPEPQQKIKIEKERKKETNVASLIIALLWFIAIIVAVAHKP